ncbi:glycosyl transferase family protein [Ochrobactrum chromiisoli]|uniref:Glycosyl transferase family protein n=1 Tax=Ochrobactrum chromiisoli TaxID=2993941 RepID=A0ABT3QLZ3_9HYPH|nr:glycosyl transferase family protein [Ochrobactrum chromiisoli]MCX2696633.1 glycosyl transferase family protein [Ochrobactrum chromiisoli]
MTGKRMKTQADVESESLRLGQLRLLIALDALLVEGSVGGAAKQMGLSTAAMSRLLGQIREKFDDPIFVRSGRNMIATPKAEALRGRLRRLANETEALMNFDSDNAVETHCRRKHGWERTSTIVAPPPLGIRKVVELENHPTPEQLAAQFANIQDENDPALRLAKYIGITGRKAGHTRPLEMHEAEDAFTTIFAGQADPMQISALLRLIHYRGETAPELAGMAQAAKKYYSTKAGLGRPALDWPAYLSPNSHQSPWFMLSAILVARAGYPVVLHGNCGMGEISGKLELAAEAIKIPIAGSLSLGEEALNAHGICFMPLAGFAPQVHGLLALYPLFHSRSSINSLAHLLNPMQLSASFLGVTQPAYRELHRDAAALLDWQSVSAVSTSRDVAELVPFHAHTIYRWVDGQKSDMTLPTLSKATTDKHASLTTFEYWLAVWSGAAVDERAELTVIASAAMALMTVLGADNESYGQFHKKAEELWRARHTVM